MTTRAVLLWALVASAPACVNAQIQDWPDPMASTIEPLPPGDSKDHPPGPEEVTVLRHADPVQVRPVGSHAGIPMAFYQKQTRLTAGGQVLVSPGGRAEIMWPEGTSIVMFGHGIGWVGSPTRGEPMFEFTEVELARLELREGDQIRLVGGAVLSGSSGPYFLESSSAGTLSVHNQSKGRLTIAFRQETFELGPGQRVRLPLLSAGGVPYNEDRGLQRVAGPGFDVSVRGPLDRLGEDEEGVHLVAQDTAADQEAHGLGVRVTLGAGEEVRFASLGTSSAAWVSKASLLPGTSGPQEQPSEEIDP